MGIYMEIQRLRNELQIYSERYATELRRSGTSEKEAQEKMDKWVDDAIKYYRETGSNLTEVRNLFVILNQTIAIPQTESYQKIMVR